MQYNITLDCLAYVTLCFLIAMQRYDNFPYLQNI